MTHTLYWQPVSLRFSLLVSRSTPPQDTAASQTRPCQSPATAKSPTAADKVVPLRLLVTVSRYQADKKISNLPYSLSVIIGGPRLNFQYGGAGSVCGNASY